MKYSRKFINEEIGRIAKNKLQAFDLAMYLMDSAKLMKLWRKAENFKDFIRMVVNSDDREVKFSDFATFYFGNVSPDWYYRREFCSVFGKEVIKTSSDAGCLKLGCNGLNVLVSNHFGDAMNRVAIFDHVGMDHAVSHLFPHSDVTLQGEEINVYGYDCGEDVVYTLSGMWHVYSDDRFFALVKWSD